MLMPTRRTRATSHPAAATMMRDLVTYLGTLAAGCIGAGGSIGYIGVAGSIGSRSGCRRSFTSITGSM